MRIQLSELVFGEKLQQVHTMHFVTGPELTFTSDCVQQCWQHHSQIWLDLNLVQHQLKSCQLLTKAKVAINILSVGALQQYLVTLRFSETLQQW